MEEKEKISYEAGPIINNFNLEDILRCPECNLKCSLILKYNDDGKPYINYKCEKHDGKMELKNYFEKYNKYTLLEKKCDECGKMKKDVKGDFTYCKKCEKFLCDICQLNHPNGDKHDIIYYIKNDSLCQTNSNTLCSYCLNCKRNLCIYCTPIHEFFNLVDLSNLYYSEESKKISEEEINNLENKIKNLENEINNLDNLKQNIISEIDKLKELSELVMKFIKILFSYQYKEQQNLNYNIIQNLKNLKSNKIEIYEEAYKKGNKYISLLQNLQNIKSNSFKNNFKTLSYHTEYIFHIDKLNDGRLISCSNDSTLNIYKNNSYDLQLSIKEHSCCIHSFTQINDGRIITCSEDRTMKIIKLIGEDKYQIEQTLERPIGHTNQVYKIIEIKENKLVSISLDKTMRIWILNNENKLIWIKTITFQNSERYCNILKLNENEFVTSSYGDKCLKFWDSNNYSNIAILNNIETFYGFKTMCLLEDDILCVGGYDSKGFYLINISTHQLIKNILGPKNIFSINKCLDGLILCSIFDIKDNNCLVKYKYEEQNLKIIVENIKAHECYIWSCVELNDGTIASGGNDRLIKLWRD